MMVQKNLWWGQKEKGDTTNGIEKTVVVGTQKIWRLPVASIGLTWAVSSIAGRSSNTTLAFWRLFSLALVYANWVLRGSVVWRKADYNGAGMLLKLLLFVIFLGTDVVIITLYSLFTGRNFTFMMKGSYEETRNISMGPSCSQRGSDSTMFHYIKYSQPNLDVMLPKECLYCGVCFCLQTVTTAKVTLGEACWINPFLVDLYLWFVNNFPFIAFFFFYFNSAWCKQEGKRYKWSSICASEFSGPGKEKDSSESE